MRFKSFTVIELIVALLISSVIVTIAFLSYLNIEKSIRNINANYSESEQIQTLRFLLKKDANLTHDWLSDHTKLTSLKDSIQYEFESDHIKRYQNGQLKQFDFQRVEMTTRVDGLLSIKIYTKGVWFNFSFEIENDPIISNN